MLQPVFDNDYMPRIAESGWPAHWQLEPPTDGHTAGAWNSDDYATFHTNGAALASAGFATAISCRRTDSGKPPSANPSHRRTSGRTDHRLHGL